MPDRRTEAGYREESEEGRAPPTGAVACRRGMVAMILRDRTVRPKPGGRWNLAVAAQGVPLVLVFRPQRPSIASREYAAKASTRRHAAPLSIERAAISAPSAQLAATPAATKPADVLAITISRAAPGAPPSTALAISRLRAASPPLSCPAVATGTPKSPGSKVRRSTAPLAISNTSVGPVVVISSRPSEPCTTKPRRSPSAASAPASNSAVWASGAPTSWASAPAGLVSGPSRLNTVRSFKSARTGCAWRIAVCSAGANKKPIPTSRMARAVSAASSAISIPKDSSRSALPAAVLEIDRLPCLATCTPAPAATNAASVDMLKVPALSPPVPQVSSSGCPWGKSGCTFTAMSRMARARPTNSATAGPFIRIAIAKAAICAWLARPSKITRMAASASAASRSWRSTMRPIKGNSDMIYCGFGVSAILNTSRIP